MCGGVRKEAENMRAKAERLLSTLSLHTELAVYTHLGQTHTVHTRLALGSSSAPGTAN